MYDSLYNLIQAEDNIRPEKYIVNGYPQIHEFPDQHPNRILYEGQFSKDEL